MSLHDLPTTMTPVPGSAAARMLARFDDAPFRLHLTGSQYAGTDRMTSDWDFLAEASLTSIDWLQEQGFVPVLRGHHPEADGDVVAHAQRWAERIAAALAATPDLERQARDAWKELTALYWEAQIADERPFDFCLVLHPTVPVQVKLVTSLRGACAARDLVYGSAMLRAADLRMRTTRNMRGRAVLWTQAAVFANALLGLDALHDTRDAGVPAGAFDSQQDAAHDGYSVV